MIELYTTTRWRKKKFLHKSVYGVNDELEKKESDRKLEIKSRKDKEREYINSES